MFSEHGQVQALGKACVYTRHQANGTVSLTAVLRVAANAALLVAASSISKYMANS